MAKKTSLTKILRKTQKTAVLNKGRVKLGRREGQMGKEPVDIMGGGSVLKKKKR